MWFCVARWDKIVQTLATLSAGTIALATLATVLAKFGRVLTMRTAALGDGLPLPVKAPAGLGVRERILTFAMLPYLPIETSVLLASMSGVVYFAAELIVVVSSFFMEREGGSAPRAPGA